MPRNLKNELSVYLPSHRKTALKKAILDARFPIMGPSEIRAAFMKEHGLAMYEEIYVEIKPILYLIPSWGVFRTDELLFYFVNQASDQVTESVKLDQEVQVLGGSVSSYVYSYARHNTLAMTLPNGSKYINLYKAMRAKADELQEKRVTFEKTLTDLFRGCNSTKQLLGAWPEIAEFKEHFPEAPERHRRLQKGEVSAVLDTLNLSSS